MFLFLLTSICYIDLSNLLFGDVEQFPDTPIGNIERLMAYNKYWQAYEATGEIIESQHRKADPKVYRLRAQCAVTMTMSKDAIENSNIVLNNHNAPSEEKSLCYQIRCRAHVQLGKFKDAEADAKKCHDRSTKEESHAAFRLDNEITRDIRDGNIKEATLKLDKLLTVATNSASLKLKRANLAWDAKDYKTFSDVSKDLPNKYPNDLQFIYRYGIVSMCNGHLDEANKKIASIMKHKGAPKGCKEAKRAIKSLSKHYLSAKKALNNKDTQNVNESLTKFFKEGLEFCDFKSALIKNANIIKAKSIRMEGDNNRTLDFLNEMVANYTDTTDFELERGEVSLEEGDYDTAIFDFESVLRKGNNPRAREGLEKAQQMKREKTTVDYYKVLGCPRDATTSEIKAAFRKATIKWHPDRYRDPTKKKEAEKMMSKINNAYDVLSDPKKKQMYDQGVDPENPEFGGFETGFNPFDLFGFPFGGGDFQQQNIHFGDGNGFHFEFNF